MSTPPLTIYSRRWSQDFGWKWLEEEIVIENTKDIRLAKYRKCEPDVEFRIFKCEPQSCIK